MEQKFETIDEDEFAQLLANAVIVMHRLPIPFSTIEQVVAEAMEEEAMYRFAEVEVTEKHDKLLLELINTWCKKLSKLTGKAWVIEKIRVTKHE